MYADVCVFAHYLALTVAFNCKSNVVCTLSELLQRYFHLIWNKQIDSS